jgi:hypothetical protein
MVASLRVTLMAMKAVAGARLGLILLVVVGCGHQPVGERNQAHLDDEFFQDAPPKGVQSMERPETLPPRDCTLETTEVAPLDGRISMRREWIQTYVPGSGSTFPPRVEVKRGALHVVAYHSQSAVLESGSVIMHFPKCIDASAWTGVRFTIRGSFRGCTLRFRIGDVQHEDRNNRAPFASGVRGSVPSEAELPLSLDKPDAQVVQVPFQNPPMASAATPPVPLDRSKLTSVLWKLSDAYHPTETCTANVVVDNLSFY